MKTNKIISEIPYQTICRNYVVRIYLEKENIAIVLTLMLKEASKNVASVINGIYKAEIGQKMQTLDKILKNRQIFSYNILRQNKV